MCGIAALERLKETLYGNLKNSKPVKLTNKKIIK